MMDSAKIQSPFRLAWLPVLIALLAVHSGCGSQAKDSKISSEYQAVFLDNGQVFFGKMENVTSDYPILREVYYVQTQQDPETNQVKSILIKRGQEWHSPDVMYINSRHIVVIESVSPTSKVAQLIEEAKNQQAAQTP